MINKRAERLGLDIKDIEIVNPRHDNQMDRREKYAAMLVDKKQREGVTLPEAREKMFSRSTFGMMMVEAGDADAFVAGSYSPANKMVERAADIVGYKDGFNHFATMHILNTRMGTYFLADTAVNPIADKDTLVDIARLANDAVKFFAHDPVLAMLSYSNFGSSMTDEGPRRVSEAVKILHEKYPDIAVGGEMQADYALNPKLRDETFPFNTIKGRQVNTLVFPNLASANITYKMFLGMGVGHITGPIQIGLRKPIFFTGVNSDVRDIIDMATIAALEASILKHK